MGLVLWHIWTRERNLSQSWRSRSANLKKSGVTVSQVQPEFCREYSRFRNLGALDGFSGLPSPLLCRTCYVLNCSCRCIIDHCPVRIEKFVLERMLRILFTDREFPSVCRLCQARFSFAAVIHPPAFPIRVYAFDARVVAFNYTARRDASFTLLNRKRYCVPGTRFNFQQRISRRIIVKFYAHYW